MRKHWEHALAQVQQKFCELHVETAAIPLHSATNADAYALATEAIQLMALETHNACVQRTGIEFDHFGLHYTQSALQEYLQARRERTFGIVPDWHTKPADAIFIRDEIAQEDVEQHIAMQLWQVLERRSGVQKLTPLLDNGIATLLQEALDGRPRRKDPARCVDPYELAHFGCASFIGRAATLHDMLNAAVRNEVNEQFLPLFIAHNAAQVETQYPLAQFSQVDYLNWLVSVGGYRLAAGFARQDIRGLAKYSFFSLDLHKGASI